MTADGEQTQKSKGGGGDEEADPKGEGGQKLAKKGEELKGEMDDLLDEIDNVLEENAEEFVKNYVQRGGQ
jgi:ubiquitin-like protein Pup